MKQLNRKLALFLGAAACSLGARMALAGPPSKISTTISLAEARAAAVQAVPGEVLSYELENEHGKSVYSFKILAQGASKGDRKEVNVDSRTGFVAIESDDDGDHEDTDAQSEHEEDDDED